MSQSISWLLFHIQMIYFISTIQLKAQSRQHTTNQCPVKYHSNTALCRICSRHKKYVYSFPTIIYIYIYNSQQYFHDHASSRIQNSLLSSMMVTVAWSGFRVTRVRSLERCTENLSFFSSLLSLIIGILIICIVALGVKVMVPLVEL